MNADTIAQAALNADVARTLLLEAADAERDFDHYVILEGIHRPHGTTLVQWREDTIGQLLADAAVRVERLASLLGVQGVR